MKKPIIGITLDSEKKKTYSKFPWYALRENYLTSLTKFNAIPFPLLHEKKYIDDFCHLIDGLIITGGDFDIHPKLYKTSNTCLLYTSPSPRDVEESRMPSSA